jgi:hypothetical protein
MGYEVAEDDPITLAVACKLFPHAKFTVSALRAEADRNRLDIFRLGRRDYTTLRSMREMVQKAPRRKSARKNEPPATQSASALAAANQTVRMLKSA